MIACRVLPHQAADGAANMAIDETMLEAVADDPSRALFRSYTWTSPTLSLGYFQPIALAEAEPRWRDAPLVRRPTGGGALWHDHEITYALVIPKSDPMARRSASLYRAVHDAIASVVRECGVPAALRGESAEPRRTRPFLCFADRDPGDVVSGEVKIVGSAQRRRAGAILQHGSLLLARSARTPEFLGIGDLGANDLDPLAWAGRLRAVIPKALGLKPVDDSFSAAEIRRAEALATAVYRTTVWTHKR